MRIISNHEAEAWSQPQSLANVVTLPTAKTRPSENESRRSKAAFVTFEVLAFLVVMLVGGAAVHAATTHLSTTGTASRTCAAGK